MTATMNLAGIDDPRIDQLARECIENFRSDAASTRHGWRRPDRMCMDATGAAIFEWTRRGRTLTLELAGNSFRATRGPTTDADQAADCHEDLWDWLHGEPRP